MHASEGSAPHSRRAHATHAIGPRRSESWFASRALAYLGGAEGLPKDKLLRTYLADTRRGHLDGKPRFDENDVLEFATHLVPPRVGRVSLKWMTDVLNMFHEREDVPGSNYSEQSWRRI